MSESSPSINLVFKLYTKEASDTASKNADQSQLITEPLPQAFGLADLRVALKSLREKSNQILTAAIEVNGDQERTKEREHMLKHGKAKCGSESDMDSEGEESTIEEETSNAHDAWMQPILDYDHNLPNQGRKEKTRMRLEVEIGLYYS